MSSAQASLFDEPRARASDPRTSHLAAASVAPAIPEMEAAVLQAAWELYLPATPFQIADQVRRTVGERWDAGGLRSCVSRLWKRGELVQDGEGRSPRGANCMRLRIPSSSYRWERVEDVPTGDAL